MRNHLRSFLSLFLLITIAPSVSRAAFVLSVSDGVSFGPSVVNLNQGETVTITFLLEQTSPDTELDDALTGLILADFQAMIAGSDITVSNEVIDPSFIDLGGTGTNVANDTVRFELQEPTMLGFTGVTTSVNNSVVLGTADFTASATATGTHLVTLVANEDGFGDRFARADVIFPVTLVVTDSMFSFNVTAVPEPSSFAVLMMVGGVLTLRRRRRSV